MTTAVVSRVLLTRHHLSDHIAGRGKTPYANVPLRRLASSNTWPTSSKCFTGLMALRGVFVNHGLNSQNECRLGNWGNRRKHLSQRITHHTIHSWDWGVSSYKFRHEIYKINIKHQFQGEKKDSTVVKKFYCSYGGIFYISIFVDAHNTCNSFSW